MYQQHQVYRKVRDVLVWILLLEITDDAANTQRN